MSKRSFGGGAWCVVGDFNTILHREERRGVSVAPASSYSSEILEFQAFVDGMELEDLLVLGLGTGPLVAGCVVCASP
jgi:hypothetical protein